jgi:tRNA pseudouridine55 synthase
VTVHRAERLWHEGDRAAFEIECSSGTYVRQLIADLGDAYCDELERTAIGDFRLAEADPERVVAPNDALAFLAERALDGDEAAAVRNGIRVAAADGEEGAALRLTHAGEVVAIAERRGQELQPVVVFGP